MCFVSVPHQAIKGLTSFVIIAAILFILMEGFFYVETNPSCTADNGGIKAMGGPQAINAAVLTKVATWGKLQRFDRS